MCRKIALLSGSLGRCSLGLRSLGLRSLGRCSLGLRSLGLRSLGGCSLGPRSLGGCSLGSLSLGSLGVGSLERCSLGAGSLGSLGLRSFASLSLALLLAGCVDRAVGTDSDSQGSSGGTDGTSTTAVVPTTGGGEASTTGGGGMSAGTSETTVAPTSTTAEPGTSTGADTGEEVGMVCMAACEHIFECVMDLPGTVADCRAGCIDEWGAPRCGQAGVDLLQCMIGMNCAQLMAYVEDDEPGVCGGAAEAADAVCGGTSGCLMSGSGGGNVCSVSRECDGSVEELQCDGQSCTCVIDGAPGESCEDIGVCALDLEEQAATAQACCGWDWS